MRTMGQTGTSLTTELEELAKIIDSHPDWWRFPTQEPVKGFMGTGKVFIVGDQPSTNPWPESHPNRRAFYGILPRIGAASAHLTDLYKRRGKAGALRSGLPSDFEAHVAFLRRELSIIRPQRVIALGHHAYQLLWDHITEVRPILRKMWHFAYPVRYGKLDQYEANTRKAFDA